MKNMTTEEIAEYLEENKYYTPKIEEFHVGFECEIQSSYGWQKGSYPTIFQEDTLSGFEVNDVGVFKTLEKRYKYLRVKYLDREDIESLGWIHEEDNLFSFKSGEVTYYLIFYPKFDNKIEIRCTHPSVSYGNFLGNCKNKSELKRVMEQLTINKL